MTKRRTPKKTPGWTPPRTKHPRSGILAALTAALSFGASSPFAKALLSEVTRWLMAGLLCLGSGVGLSLYRGIRRSSRPKLEPGEWAWLVGAIVAGGVTGPVLLMFGLTGMHASDASLLLNAEGVFTALLAWFTFRENFDRRIALDMILIAAGAVVSSWPEKLHLSRLWPSLAVVGACFAWGLDNSLIIHLAGPRPGVEFAVEAEWAVRDRLRKRSQWLQQRTSHLLAVQNLLARNRGESLSANAVKRLSSDAVEPLLSEPYLALAVNSNRRLIKALDEQIMVLEKTVKAHIKPSGALPFLLSVSGIGDILGLTILLVPGLGVGRSGPLRGTLRRADQALRPAQVQPEQHGSRDQDRGAQAGAGVLFHFARPGVARREPGVCMST